MDTDTKLLYIARGIENIALDYDKPADEARAALEHVIATAKAAVKNLDQTRQEQAEIFAERKRIKEARKAGVGKARHRVATTGLTGEAAVRKAVAEIQAEIGAEKDKEKIDELLTIEYGLGSMLPPITGTLKA